MKIITIKLVTVVTLLIAIAISIFTIIYPYKDKYFTQNYWQHFPELKRAFMGSQYMSKTSAGILPDETVYAYAGGELILGTSPILVNPEVPPLGKYLIGLSTVLFNNPNILIMLVCGFFALLFMYLLGTQIYKSKITALIPILFLTIEPLFRNQFVYVPHFEIAQLFFLFAALFFFNKFFIQETKNVKYIILAQIFLGCFISTKFYMFGITIIGAFLLVLAYNNDKSRLKILLLSSIIPVCILYLTYIQVLIIGYPINRFLGIQRWIFDFHTGKLSLPFTVWPLIYLNQWHVWWGDKPILSDSQWRISWPLTTTMSLVTGVLYSLKRIPQKKEVEILIAYALTYGLFASLGQTSARYLVIYLPILYMLSVYFLEHLVTRYIRK